MTFKYYVGMVRDVALSTLKGMAQTFRILYKVVTKGPITIQYPEQKDKIPLGSRGLLFNDVDDCISCKQCAQVCPVDCIYIEAEKKPANAAPVFTRGGTKITLDLKRFDIDKSLCCFCGLCSAACPTECLYHTKEYEYSKYDRDNHVYDYLHYKQ